MKIFRDMTDLPLDSKAAVSIGNFDGVHSGHRVLVKELCSHASRFDVPSMVVTFDPHPMEVLEPSIRLPKLNTIERRAELLSHCGVDAMVVLKTTDGLLDLNYIEFFEEYVVRKFNACALVEGPNFFFGKDRKGNTDRLQDLCFDNSVHLSIVDICRTGDRITSSSLIRRMINEGLIDEANRLLTENYQIKGLVVPGAARGQTIGFPTANLSQVEMLLPKDGVYGGLARVEEELVPCAINIGQNPTFDEGKRKVEVHLIDKDIDLYGKELAVDLIVRIRGVQRFDNSQELVTQISKDVSAINSFLSGMAK